MVVKSEYPGATHVLAYARTAHTKAAVIRASKACLISASCGPLETMIIGWPGPTKARLHPQHEPFLWTRYPGSIVLHFCKRNLPNG